MDTEQVLDLSKYWERFDEALKGRYKGETFKDGFERIKNLYRDVTSGERRLTVDDVMAIFASDLPFVQDWTMPDRLEIEKRLNEHGVADAIYRLLDRDYDHDLIGRIRYGFRELSLTALVLHHVYPKRFAMCSHHLASLLYITNAPTVPEFYIKYCKELKLWGDKKSTRKLSVVEIEFALWTWYRLAYYGREEEKKKNRKVFFKDPWVQDRRAILIAESLKETERLDLARSYLATDPNVAAIIAWVEFESMARKVLRRKEIGTPPKPTIRDLITRLPANAVPKDQRVLMDLWNRNGRGRNKVMHDDLELSKDEAASVLDGVVEFIEYNNNT